MCLGIMPAKHVTKTKESRTQCNNCDKVTDGEHKQVPPSKISQKKLTMFLELTKKLGVAAPSFFVNTSDICRAFFSQ